MDTACWNFCSKIFEELFFFLRVGFFIEPAFYCIAVVCAGENNGVFYVIVREMRICFKIAFKGIKKHPHAGKLELFDNRFDILCDVAKVFDDDGFWWEMFE